MIKINIFTVHPMLNVRSFAAEVRSADRKMAGHAYSHVILNDKAGSV